MTLVLLPLLLGLAFTGIAWPRASACRSESFARGTLALGLGLGISSLVFFLVLVLAGSARGPFVLAEIAILIVLGKVLLSRTAPVPAARRSASARVSRTLVLAFAGVFVLAGITYVAFCLDKPNGGWDAWMIWNTRARFLVRAEGDWRDAFSPLLDRNHFHADYPLLVPALVARGWACLGHETNLVPVLLSLVFTASSIALLGSGVAVLRGGLLGAWAAIALACNPDFLRFGASECADVPLGFFFLATLVVLALEDSSSEPTRGFPFLAGFAAGLAAWTKNEGSLFVAVVVLVRAALPRKDGLGRRAREIGWILTGLALPLAVLAGFKLALAPPNDLVVDQAPGTIVEKLLDPQRYRYILWETTKELGKLEHWGTTFVPFLLALLVVRGARKPHERSAGLGTAAGVVLLMSLGYFCVYLTTPHRLDYHVGTSLRRLMVQLCPAGILAVFLALRPSGSGVPSPQAAPEDAKISGEAEPGR